MHLRQGQIVDDYRLFSGIGGGAKGVVWSAQRVGRGEPSVVALKFLSDRLVRDRREAARFRQEARALLKVRHPNIARVYGFGVFEEVPYIAMEYVGGLTLKEYIRRRGHVPMDEALAITAQIAAALDNCHSLGVVHRDVKALNIHISAAPNGGRRALLLDFGIAKMEDMSLSISGSVLGTPHYMSPEQARGAKLDGRSDQYSLAVVLWEMLSGQVVFTGPTMVEVCRKHMREAPGSLRIPGMSILYPAYQRIDGALRKALAKDPAGRFRRCSEFAQAVAGHGLNANDATRLINAIETKESTDRSDELPEQKPAGTGKNDRSLSGGPGPSPIGCLNVVSQLTLGLFVIILVISRLHF